MTMIMNVLIESERGYYYDGSMKVSSIAEGTKAKVFEIIDAMPPEIDGVKSMNWKKITVTFERPS